MTPMTSPKPVPHGLSVLEEKLYRHLADHVFSEADLIASYRELAEAPATPDAARYLLRLVVEDEERHHRVMHEIAPALEEATKRFLAAERTDRKELRALRKELEPYRDTTLWSLLIELMEHDTAKHILLLTFVRDHVARRPK